MVLQSVPSVKGLSQRAREDLESMKGNNSPFRELWGELSLEHL